MKKITIAALCCFTNLCLSGPGKECQSLAKIVSYADRQWFENFSKIGNESLFKQPLLTAIYNNKIEVVERFIDDGIVTLDNGLGEQLITQAENCGQKKILEYLLAQMNKTLPASDETA